MSTLHRSLPALLLAATAPALFATEAQLPAIPRYPVQKTSMAPTIDGDLRDACWAQLPQLGPFLNGNGLPADQPTYAIICYDDKYLYFAARLIEPDMEKIVCRATEHDNGATSDDDFELFIQPGNDSTEYYQFAINSAGVTEERHETDPSIQWNGRWNSAAKRLADQWVVEIAIPFETFKRSKPELHSIWRINLCRSRQISHTYSAWSPVPVFHYPTKFGEAIFLDSNKIHKADCDFGIKANDSTMRVTLKGKGDFTLSQLWNTGSTPGLATTSVSLNGDHVVSNTFALTTDQVTGQFSLTDSATRTCVFRSSPQNLMTGDRDAIGKRQIEELLGDVLIHDSPVAFDDVKQVWAASFSDKRLSDEYKDLDKTLYQVQLCKLLSDDLDRFADSEVVWFSEIPFTDVHPGYLPDANKLGNDIYLQAMRGEYEPAILGLISLVDDCKVSVSIGDLEGPNGKIFSAENIDVKTVKYWYQASDNYHPAKDGKGVFVGELLLNDDSIVVPDHETGRNKIVRRGDSKEFLPLAAERFRTRQIWLTAFIPKEQEAGTYKGSVSLLSDGILKATVPMEVRVLPVTMEPTDFTFTLYFNGRHTLGKNPLSDIAYENDLRVAFEHGMTSLMVQEGAPSEIDANGRVTSYDFSLMEKAVQLRAKHGLTGKTAFNGGHWDTLPVDAYWRTSEKEGANNPSYKANIVGFCKGMDRLVDKYGLEGGYFAGWDEATYDDTGRKMRMSHVSYAWIKDNGSKVFAAISTDGADQLGDLLDVPVFPVPTGVITQERRTMPYKESWFYGHPLEDPILERFGTGVLIWYGGYTGVSHYIYQGLGGAGDKGWDDWNGIYGYRPQMYAYPGKDGPIVTVQYEGYREGCDDVKYLEMMDRRVKQARGMKLNAEEQRLVAKASEILVHPPKKFQVTWREAPEKLTAKDFLELRYHVADLLVQMDALVSRATPDF